MSAAAAGIIGSLIFLLGYIIQIHKSYTEKQTSGLSWGMLSLLTSGTALYLFFFISRNDLALAFITSLCLAALGIISLLKKRYDPK